MKFLPREHGATAMLFTPMVCAALLARQWRWSELATVLAAFAALAAKDPMVILARQRFVWKQRRAETTAAAQWFAGWMMLLVLSGLVLLATWPLAALIPMGLCVGVFSVLAILINVKNRQRSTLFQIASALALTSSSLAISLSATGAIARWCWWLWLLLAMQATTGILVVHARLDARIQTRKNGSGLVSGDVSGAEKFRRAAFVSLAVLLGASIAAAVLGRFWIALGLLIAAAGYGYDLRSQRDPAALQMPLTTVGRRALALSSLYAVLLILGLWR